MPTFACPFCQSRVPVELDAIGTVVTCSSCARPFRPHVPEGTLFEEGEGGWHAVRPRAGDAADEQTLRRVRPAAFRRAPVQSFFLFLGAGVALTAALYVAMTSERQTFVVVAAIAGILIALLCLIPLVIAFIETRFESLTVTTQRSLWRRGIFTKNTSEVQHDDIRNIQVRQGLLDQLLGVGTVSISSAGQDDMEIVVHGVQRPAEFVELVRQYQRRLISED